MAKQSNPPAIGARFGRWRVIKSGVFIGGRAACICVCLCKLKTKRLINLANLRQGESTSCGCQRGESKRTHGLSRTPIYASYRAMLDRCYKRHHHKWNRYGGLGVTVCKRWRDSIKAFMDDMRPTWKKGWTLERKNPFGNYNKRNCTWVPKSLQSTNQRRNYAGRSSR